MSVSEKNVDSKTSFTSEAAHALCSSSVQTPADDLKYAQVAETENAKQRGLCPLVYLQRQNDWNRKSRKNKVGENIDCWFSVSYAQPMEELGSYRR